MDCSGLTVEVRQEPELTLVTVAGEVDIATVPALLEGLAGPTASGKPIIVELDAVSFIDATGLGALAQACRNLAAVGDVPGQRPPAYANGPGPSRLGPGPRTGAGLSVTAAGRPGW